MKSRRVGFCLSSRQEEVIGFNSWLPRHPPHHPYRFQRFAYNAPFTAPNPLHPHRPQRFAHPLYVVVLLPHCPHRSSAIVLTLRPHPSPLWPPPQPSALRPRPTPSAWFGLYHCRPWSDIQRLPMEAQTPSAAPTALNAPITLNATSSALCQPTLRRRLPPSLLPRAPPLQIE